MRTTALEPSTYARERLAELTADGYGTEVLATTVEGAVFVLMEDEIPMFIAHAEDTPRSELGKQVFIVNEHAEQSFQRVLHSHVDENFRLQWMH